MDELILYEKALANARNALKSTQIDRAFIKKITREDGLLRICSRGIYPETLSDDMVMSYQIIAEMLIEKGLIKKYHSSNSSHNLLVRAICELLLAKRYI